MIKKKKKILFEILWCIKEKQLKKSKGKNNVKNIITYIFVVNQAFKLQLV